MKAATLLLLAAVAATPASRPQRYALVLQEPPAAARLVAAGAKKGVSRSAIAAAGERAIRAQSPVRAALEDRGIRVTSANSFLANVLFVEASSEQEAELRALPGVAYVEQLQPIRPQLARAVELMNVPRAWTQVNGEQNAGAGIRIGLLDTGIDHTHPAFLDNSLQFPSGFPKCDDRVGDCAYTNRKIIVARSYVGMLVGTDPRFTRPDDLSPRDRVGHGTAVAMAAAGVRNTGPAGTITGVAPKAFLGNYKVFGSPGVNGDYTFDDVLLQAIEDANRDGMDMIVMSLGGSAVWGPNDRGRTCNETGTTPCDFRADAIEYAAKLGMLTVVAAGNSGGDARLPAALASVETPGTSPSAITVGATTSDHIYYQTAQVNGSNVSTQLRAINARFGDGPKPGAPLTAPLRDVAVLEGSGNANACKPLANNSLSGAIAIIERGGCELTVKINNAQRAGAVGVVLTQLQGINGVFPIVGLQQTSIPSVLIGNRDAVALRSYVLANNNATVTLDPALREVRTTEYDTVATFSSRGPSIRENAIKPEVMAVGTDLYVTTQRYDPNGSMYDPSGYTAVEGTSFAAPQVAGVAAMIWQRNPRWLPADVKSAIVNTADARIKEDYGNGLTAASVVDQGAGIVNADSALRTNVTVSPATLSFGVLGSNPNPSVPMTLCNFSNAPLTLRLEIRPFGNQRTLLVLSANSVTINANSCRERELVASLNTNSAPAGIYEGAVIITGGAITLRVPYLYLVGDGAPTNILPLRGNGFVGDLGGNVTLLFKVLDRWGVPVRNAPVTFQSTFGGGAIASADSVTDDLGIAFATATLGQQYGDQEFYASVGSTRDFGIYFSGRARIKPTADGAGVVNAASGELGRGIAPGSYVSIFGRGLGEVTSSFSTPYLPLAVAGVSVSFDVPSKNLSLPGRIQFVSDGQINVQAPWELQGSPSAQIKVSIGDSSTSVLTVQLQDYSPAAFEYPESSSGRRLAAALDSTYALIGTGNPAKQGDVIQIYSNGLGPVNNQPASGEPSPSQPLATTRVVPTVTIGGLPAEVLFSGLAPQFVGLYQLNVRVPSDVPSGLQSLVITSNGINSKSSTIPVR